MRSHPLDLFVRVTAVFALVVLSGCSNSHQTADDAGSGDDGAVCGGGGSSALICVSTCSSDAGLAPVCTDGAWQCPPGTVDLSTCPSTRCPDGLNPWDRTDPLRACSSEGATCSNGGDACGEGVFCDCRAGLWQCAVAEPDPACWCGREPSVGGRCSEEGASCGECCPTPGGTGWPAMECVDGRWAAASCPPVLCLLLECPADTGVLVGHPCEDAGASCGDACCGSAITCSDGVWVAEPSAMCTICSQLACGDGFCPASKLCTSRCGPTDGIEYVCTSPPSGCTDCSCIPLTDSQRCEMIEGRPRISNIGVCG